MPLCHHEGLTSIPLAPWLLAQIRSRGGVLALYTGHDESITTLHLLSWENIILTSDNRHKICYFFSDEKVP